MKKIYNLQDLDCANCAAKMECAINKIEGVQSASVSFVTQKIILEADESELPAIEKQMVKTCRKIEPDCRIKL